MNERKMIVITAEAKKRLKELSKKTGIKEYVLASKIILDFKIK